MKLDPRFQEMTKNSLKSLLIKENFSEELSQFGSAACLVNYNQNADIHGFVGLVSLAGADSNLWKVKSQVGNRDIPLSLFQLSGASLLLNTNVLGLKQDNDEICLTFSKDGVERNLNFDFVVIAFPLNKNVKNFDLGFEFDYKSYEMQLTKTYFIEGNVYLYPQVPINRRNELISCDDSIDFRSVSVQFPCDYSDKTDSHLWLDKNKKLYKVFSSIDLDDVQLRKIFSDDYKICKKIDWYAYPKYDRLINNEKRKEFPPVIIDSKERVFYINSIEWSASCMETSCISARNIALMISKKVQKVEKTNKSNTQFFKNSSNRISLLVAVLFLLFSYLIKQLLSF
jgi:prenylcysteine oxidase/farnesylcysteine lyase